MPLEEPCPPRRQSDMFDEDDDEADVFGSERRRNDEDDEEEELDLLLEKGAKFSVNFQQFLLGMMKNFHLKFPNMSSSIFGQIL